MKNITKNNKQNNLISKIKQFFSQMDGSHYPIRSNLGKHF